MRMNGASQAARGGALSKPLRASGLTVSVLALAGFQTELSDRDGGGFYKTAPALQDREHLGGKARDE
jgi:hypothetical protein